MIAQNQLLLNFKNSVPYKSEDFIVGKANKQAYTYILENSENWETSCTILTGEKGAGKSFLAKLWQEKTRAQVIDNNAVNIEEYLTSQNILIEDVDTNISPITLFHTINFTQQNNTKLLLTTSHHNILHLFSLKDLTSRLRQAKYLTLNQPDDLLLVQLFYKCFANQQIDIDTAPIEYLLTKIERNYHNIEKIVGYINKMSLIEKRPITKKFIATKIEAITDDVKHHFNEL